MVAIVMPLARILQAHLNVLVRQDLSETEQIASRKVSVITYVIRL